MRVGIGYDSHRFGEDRPLVLGGVVIPHGVGLHGHSDADAVAHAITDAMLGAACLGDIGRLFPDTDPAHKNIDSMQILATVRDLLRTNGWVLQQTDVTVILEEPKLSPRIGAMQERLCEVLGVGSTSVSIKAKTNEGMGFVGTREGIAVVAIATIVATPSPG